MENPLDDRSYYFLCTFTTHVSKMPVFMFDENILQIYVMFSSIAYRTQLRTMVLFFTGVCNSIHACLRRKIIASGGLFFCLADEKTCEVYVFFLCFEITE